MAKSKAKRTPMSRIPVSMRDVQKAREDGIRDGCRLATAMFFTVLKDKWNASNEDLHTIWTQTESLADSVSKRYVNADDLVAVLREEYDIALWN